MTNEEILSAWLQGKPMRLSSMPFSMNDVHEILNIARAYILLESMSDCRRRINEESEWMLDQMRSSLGEDERKQLNAVGREDSCGFDSIQWSPSPISISKYFPKNSIGLVVNGEMVCLVKNLENEGEK